MNPEQTLYLKQLTVEIESGKLQGKLAKHKWGSIVKMAPNFFKLLCALQEDTNIPDTANEILNGGMKYFLSDVDFLPESLVGLSGYLDDVLVAAYVVKEVSKEVDPQYISMLWEGDKDLFLTIDDLLESASAILGENLWGKIRSSL